MKFAVKYIFGGLLALTLFASLYLGATFTAKWIKYQKFSHTTHGTATYWGVLSLSDEAHHVCVDYYFRLGEELFCAQYMYPKPVYKTKEAALDAMEEMKKTDLTVWYKRKPNRAPASLLELTFPKNELIKLVLALGIFVYFLWLKSYLRAFAIDKPHPTS